MKKLIIFAIIALTALLYVGCDVDDTAGPGDETAYVPKLFINEFLASNDFATVDPDEDETDGDPQEDWFEIYNADTFAVNIAGMYVTDDLTNTMLYQIPATDATKTTIVPGGFLIIWCDKEMHQGPTHVDMALSAGGEDIGLYMSDGVTKIDELTYLTQETDKSYGRVTDGGDEWQVFTAMTPGASNTGAVPDTVLYINEYLASNDAGLTDPYGEFEDWIEIYNASTFAVNIGGMYITDDLTDLLAYQIPTTYPDSTTIPSGGFLLLYADKQADQGILHVDIKLSGDGESIGLTASDGTTVMDSLSFGAQTTDVSVGRQPDGSSNWVSFTVPTPGASNN